MDFDTARQAYVDANMTYEVQQMDVLQYVISLYTAGGNTSQAAIEQEALDILIDNAPS